MRAAAILVLACSFVHAQSQTTQTFHFPATDGVAAMQSTVNALRSVLELTNVAFDPAAQTTTVVATPGDIALAEWLFTEMELPALSPGDTLRVDQNPGPSGPSDRLFVYRLANMNSVEMVNQLQGFQNVVNLVRVLPQLSKVFPRAPNFAIAVRGSEDQLALVTWLLQQLDQPIAVPGAKADQKFQSNVAGSSDVRVLYFAHALTEAQQMPVINAVRTVPELTRVFPATSKGALAVAGSADRVAMAEWLFQLLDAAAPQTTYSASQPYALTPGLDVAQVFYLPAWLTDQAFTESVNHARQAASITHAFPDAPARAFAVRGTPAQLAQAAQVLEQAGKN